VIDALASQYKCLRGAKVLVLGAAYKKDIDDCRESPSLKILSLLRRKGAAVEYNDDYVPEVCVDGVVMQSVKNPEYEAYDCVVIATDHSYYDFPEIVRRSLLVVDSRDATKMRGVPHVFVL
jgi:UDP-N-acetyl-D-glucosamine dehydrogenase